MSFIILKVTNDLNDERERPINIDKITNIEPIRCNKCRIWFNGDNLIVNHTMEELIGILPFAGIPIYPKDGGWTRVEDKTIYRPGDEKIEPE